jgi:hypothetical protein
LFVGLDSLGISSNMPKNNLCKVWDFFGENLIEFWILERIFWLCDVQIS